MFFFGATALELIFGNQYSNQQWLISILGVCPIAWSLSAVFVNGLAVLEQTRSVFLGTIVGLIVTIVLVFPLSLGWDMEGAAFALFVGSSVSSACLFYSFFAKTRELLAEGATL